MVVTLPSPVGDPLVRARLPADGESVGRDVLLVGVPGTVEAFPSEEDGRLYQCSSPAEALARLRSGAPCDVVVAAELPGMDGVNLLARLRDEYPWIARILVAPPPAILITGIS